MMVLIVARTNTQVKPFVFDIVLYRRLRAVLFLGKHKIKNLSYVVRNEVCKEQLDQSKRLANNDAS